MARRSKWAHVEMPDPNATKRCIYCSKDFHPKRYEPRDNFERRQHCSMDCKFAIRRAQRADQVAAAAALGKICQGPKCGKVLTLRPNEKFNLYWKEGDSQENFRLRNTCSQVCKKRLEAKQRRRERVRETWQRKNQVRLYGGVYEPLSKTRASDELALLDGVRACPTCGGPIRPGQRSCGC